MGAGAGVVVGVGELALRQDGEDNHGGTYEC